MYLIENWQSTFIICLCVYVDQNSKFVSFLSNQKRKSVKTALFRENHNHPHLAIIINHVMLTPSTILLTFPVFRLYNTLLSILCVNCMLLLSLSIQIFTSSLVTHLYLYSERILHKMYSGLNRHTSVK